MRHGRRSAVVAQHTGERRYIHLRDIAVQLDELPDKPRVLEPRRLEHRDDEAARERLRGRTL